MHIPKPFYTIEGQNNLQIKIHYVIINLSKSTCESWKQKCESRNIDSTNKKGEFVMMKTMPKYLTVIIALVALFSMLLRMSDNIEYLSIVAERSSVASSVSSGKVDFATIQSDYENCIYRMQKLEERSDYGLLLSSIDGMNAGKFVNAVIILAQTAVAIGAIIVLGMSLGLNARCGKYSNQKQKSFSKYVYVGKYSVRKKRVKAHPRGKRVA